MAKEIDKHNYNWCFDILRAPVVTEKMRAINDGGYAFIVSDFATKNTVKSAVEKVFKVDVLSVNVLNRKGKRKRFKGVIGRRGGCKMAFVKLKADQLIDIEAEV